MGVGGVGGVRLLHFELICVLLDVDVDWSWTLLCSAALSVSDVVRFQFMLLTRYRFIVSNLLDQPDKV